MKTLTEAEQHELDWINAGGKDDPNEWFALVNDGFTKWPRREHVITDHQRFTSWECSLIAEARHMPHDSLAYRLAMWQTKPVFVPHHFNPATLVITFYGDIHITGLETHMTIGQAMGRYFDTEPEKGRSDGLLHRTLLVPEERLTPTKENHGRQPRKDHGNDKPLPNISR